MRTQKQLLRQKHIEAQVIEILSRTHYKDKMKKEGLFHPETRKARDRYLKANAMLYAEKAKRLLQMIPKAKGKRKITLQKELKAAEEIYETSQRFRGL